MQGYNYQFTALRGIQAGREYYVAMCPLKLIPRIFLFDEEELPPELRAQRVLNRARVPQISRYLLQNPDDYAFSALTASIDGEVKFQALESQGFGRNAGVLTIPMTSRFLINDGQHRRAAIEEALKENPRLGDESITVVFYVDQGLLRSQQLFADLNTHAVRPTRSLGILYDHRDAFSELARVLSQVVPIFKGLTETEKTTISNRSTKLFTLSAIHQSTLALLGKARTDLVTDDDAELAKRYWTALGEIIPEWRMIVRREVSAAVLRSEYVHSHGVALHALGIVGHSLTAAYPLDWPERLNALGEVGWHRSNKIWHGRAIVRGKMSKADESVELTASYLKQVLGLELEADDQRLERLLSEN